MLFNRKISPQNKAVLITGCDSGFGNSLALKLNKKGFRVYATVLDPNSVGAKQLSEECDYINKMTVLEMNVTNQQMVDHCFDFVKTDLLVNNEVLWALVNNAGTFSYGHTEWGQMDEYYKVFEVNVFGVVRVTRKFSPLIRHCQGRIVIMASIGSKFGLDNLGIYCMSKYSILCYSEVLRREMRKFKVKVSTILPGLYKTGMLLVLEEVFKSNWSKTDEELKELYGEEYFETHIKKIPNLIKLCGASKDLNKVINDMTDAVINKSPKLIYEPMPMMSVLHMSSLFPLMSPKLRDLIHISIDGTVPSSMKH